MKNKFIVGYDIQDNKKRKTITKILENHGYRWQFSVFCCDFSIAEKLKIQKNLEKIINKKTDSVFIFPITNQAMDNALFLGQLKNIIDLPYQPSFF